VQQNNVQLILLPGMDGTGVLFRPLLETLPENIEARVITYPCDKDKGYPELTEYVKGKLPKERNFILIAESFSGPIAYSISSNPPKNLKSVIFVATFINTPNRFLWLLEKLPLPLILKLPIPIFFIKRLLLGKNAKHQNIKLLKEAINKTDSETLANRIREMLYIPVEENKILVPSAYLAAGNDKLVPHRNIKEFMRIAPKIEIIMIDGPHFLLQESPKECGIEIMRILEQSPQDVVRDELQH